jgi:glycosyltransferase involved in cell wall biosynthesis
VTPPTFSVVIPAYNAARTIASTLRSVLQQTRDDFEIAVVDDGSADDTLVRIAELDDDRITVHRQQRQGPSAARNLAIAQTRGTYVCPLDADDLLLPSFLERMGAALDADLDAGFAYTDAWTLDDPTGRIRRASAKAYQRPPKPPPGDATSLLEVLLDRNFVYGCTLIRRSVLDELGGYAEELGCSEDYELWLRIAGHGYRGVKVDGRLAVYREGQVVSNSSDALRMALAHVAMYERAATTYPVSEAMQAIARSKAERWRLTADRLTTPTPSHSDAFVSALRATRARVLDPLRWHRSRPAEVERLLEATQGWPTAARVS